MRTRLIALLAGGAVALLLALTLPLDLGQMIGPVVVGIVLIAALLAEQRLAGVAARTEGSASLERRRVRDYVPACATWVAAILLVAVALLLSWTTSVASPDSAGTPPDCNYGGQGLSGFMLGLTMIAAGFAALWCLVVLLTPAAVRR